MRKNHSANFIVEAGREREFERSKILPDAQISTSGSSVRPGLDEEEEDSSASVVVDVVAVDDVVVATSRNRSDLGDGHTSYCCGCPFKLSCFAPKVNKRVSKIKCWVDTGQKL